MSPLSDIVNASWPALPYEEFAGTQYLLHMGLQAIGKLKLREPFQPQWSGLPLWVDARGLTTGPLSHGGGAYEVRADFIEHAIRCNTSAGFHGHFELGPMAVAEFVKRLFELLREAGVDVSINLRPQEVPNPIPFDQDTAQRPYDARLANAWWRILLSTQRVMQISQGRFQGKMQPVGLMWGTLDIRDVRYNGKPSSPGPANADYIRRNAMNAELIEMGWWAGSAAYPRAAFYAFTYPQPAGIENMRINPPSARWDSAMGEFILDYDDLRASTDPDGDPLAFFDSTYEAGAACSGWDSTLIGSAKPL